MKALKRNCKVPFLIGGGYFCSERRGDFNGPLFYSRALISRGRYRELGLTTAYTPVLTGHRIRRATLARGHEENGGVRTQDIEKKKKKKKKKSAASGDGLAPGIKHEMNEVIIYRRVAKSLF